MVGREGGGQGMVGIEGGEGVDAYLMEYKTTMTITSSSSSSLVSLLAWLPRRRTRHGPARPLGRSWFWGRGRACRSHLWPLVVVRGVVVVVVLAGRSLSSVWRSLVGRWPSFAGRCPLCARLSSRSAVGFVFRGRGHL